jgi:hypothetical protein
MVHAPQAMISIYLDVNTAWRWLAHERSGKLPVVTAIQRGRVEDEGGYFVVSLPIVILRVEV